VPLSSRTGRADGEGSPGWLRAGQLFGRFQIVERVGGGGMGDVYKAVDGGRLVALKVIRSGVEGYERNLLRFEREFHLARRVTHPNVCNLHELGNVGGLPYLSMEYVQGQNLRDFLHAVEGLSRSRVKLSAGVDLENGTSSPLEQGLSPWQALRIGRQICEGLAAIHESGIVHRDLKPSNVMMTRDGRVILLDFGLAYHPDADSLTASNEVLGTLRYMAPEQTRGVSDDARSDIYAFGLILYEMLTGRQPPGDGGRLPLALRESPTECPPPSRFAAGVPAELDALVERCLRGDREERYRSVEELLGDLEDAAASLEVRSSSLLPQPKAGAPRRNQAALAALAVVAVAAAAIWGLAPERDSGPKRPYYLAVAPFENASGGEDAYLAHGFTDAVMSRLMTLDGITVVSPSDETGASLQLEASVQKEGGSLRVSYRLLRMPSRESVGADVLDNDAGAIFDLQDRVAASVGSRLSSLLGEDFVVRFPDRPTEDVEVYGLYLKATSLLAERDAEKIDQAIALFERALRKDKGFTLGLVGRCQALWQKYELLKRPDTIREAERVCQDALARDDRMADVHTALGHVYRGTGRLDQATASFERAVALAPENSDAVRGLAQAFVAQGNLEAAERTYKRAIELRPDHWLGYGWLGALYWQNARYEEAAEQFEKVIEITPTNSRGYANLGSVYSAMGRHDEAISMFRLALEIKPTYYVYANLGSTYYFLGRFADAVDAMAKAVALNPDDYRAWANLGDARWWLSGRESARADFRRAIDLARRHLEVNPTDAIAWSYLASYEAKAGEEENAREHIERALELAPSDVQVLFESALVLELTDDRAGALRFLQKAAEGGFALKLVEEDPFFDALRRDPSYRGAFANAS
jgi:serine/threonine protein kinase/Flp pilus assembly protein TadD